MRCAFFVAVLPLNFLCSEINQELFTVRNIQTGISFCVDKQEREKEFKTDVNQFVF